MAKEHQYLGSSDVTKQMVPEYGSCDGKRFIAQIVIRCDVQLPMATLNAGDGETKMSAT
jgi:hypothetical protein